MVRADLTGETWEEARQQVEGARAISMADAMDHWKRNQKIDALRFVQEIVQKNRSHMRTAIRDYWPSQKWGFCFSMAKANTLLHAFVHTAGKSPMPACKWNQKAAAFTQGVEATKEGGNPRQTAQRAKESGRELCKTCFTHLPPFMKTQVAFCGFLPPSVTNQSI